jgi:hypothetical protein
MKVPIQFDLKRDREMMVILGIILEGIMTVMLQDCTIGDTPLILIDHRHRSSHLPSCCHFQP